MGKKSEGKKAPGGLDAVLAQIRQEFGDGAIMRMGDVDATHDVPSISTGSASARARISAEPT